MAALPAAGRRGAVVSSPRRCAQEPSLEAGEAGWLPERVGARAASDGAASIVSFPWHPCGRGGVRPVGRWNQRGPERRGAVFGVPEQ